jgi:hypothetical protein
MNSLNSGGFAPASKPTAKYRVGWSPIDDEASGKTWIVEFDSLGLVPACPHFSRRTDQSQSIWGDESCHFWQDEERNGLVNMA